MRVPSLRLTLITAAIAGGLLVPTVARAQGAPARNREPRGFDFSPDGVWRVRSRQVRERREAVMARGDYTSLNAALRGAANLAQASAGLSPTCPATGPMVVCGVLRVPVLLVRFKNTTASLATPPAYYDALLGATPTLGRPYTLRTFYQEMSNGLFSIQGQVIGWVTLDSNDTYYEGPLNNGLDQTGHVARLIQEAVTKNDTLDFGQFDNDGPDGVPNTSDDDGFVDLVQLVHPEQDGACGPQGSVIPLGEVRRRSR